MRRGVWALSATTALVVSACGLFRGAVNSSPGLRWWLFSNFGAQKMCPEMLKRGAPLTLVPGGNTMGRFFPSACDVQVSDERQIATLHFSGTGYGWTPLAGRVGFSMETAVEYRPDFQLTEDATYVFARTNRVVYGPVFQIGSIENKLADWASRSPAGYLASVFGSQIVESRLASGFTVVRTDQGDDFSLGILTPPARPPHPFGLEDDDRISLANETTEVRSGQVDFVGPLEVAESEQALYLRYRLQGPAVDAFVMPRSVADPWREGLQKGATLAPPPYPPVRSFTIQPGVEGSETVRLPPGQYYVVVDNSAAVGTVSPPWNPLSAIGGNAATLSLSIELGDAG
ncbi:MAG TPA: hypothetical protein VHE30_02080 [Polyangiaceae bacterium]|nr:hypothetical protein [Polyangiaceae bacterium]